MEPNSQSQTMVMNFCPNCGARVVANSNYCQVCGVKLRQEPVPSIRPSPIITPKQNLSTLEARELLVKEAQEKPLPEPSQPQKVEKTGEDYAVCPKCGGKMLPQTVAEKESDGCGMVLLAILTLGILPLIMLLVNKPTNTKTYMVCQSCGHRMEDYQWRNYLSNQKAKERRKQKKLEKQRLKEQ